MPEKINRTNVDSKLASECYKRGISLYDKQTLAPKNISKLYDQCTKFDGRTARSINKNSLNYGVPPFPERALALHKELKISKAQAKELAKNPFHNFGTPYYNPRSPKVGVPSSWPAYHDIYRVSKFFPPHKKVRYRHNQLMELYKRKNKPTKLKSPPPPKRKTPPKKKTQPKKKTPPKKKTVTKKKYNPVKYHIPYWMRGSGKPKKIQLKKPKKQVTIQMPSVTVEKSPLQSLMNNVMNLPERKGIPKRRVSSPKLSTRNLLTPYIGMRNVLKKQALQASTKNKLIRPSRRQRK